MYTAQEVDARIVRMKAEGLSRAEIIAAASDLCIGWPYVFGFGACPALSGNGSCDSCKWCGTRIFDCRGFTRWLLAQVGLTLYGGTVTAQWETASNWVYKGTIDKMPLSIVCCVFREGHTGMHLFGEVTRHCNKFVKEQMLPGVPKWQRFGIPAGLYRNEELRKAGIDVDESKNIPTLRRGSRGDMVEELQALLNAKCGYDLEIDGIYGAKTETAVTAFQLANGLTADGICGPKTWKALGVADPNQNPAVDNGNNSMGDLLWTPEEPEGETVRVALEDWRAIKAAAATMYGIIKKYEEE